MGNPFIEIRDLHKTYRSRTGDLPVLKGINLSIRKGEIFGMLGNIFLRWFTSSDTFQACTLLCSCTKQP